MSEYVSRLTFASEVLAPDSRRVYLVDRVVVYQTKKYYYAYVKAWIGTLYIRFDKEFTLSRVVSAVNYLLGCEKD